MNQGRRTIVRRHTRTLAGFLLAVLAISPLAAQAPSTAELSAIYQIKDEGFNRSQVMEIESYLTDVYGPRVTTSPNIQAAAEWATT